MNGFKQLVDDRTRSLGFVVENEVPNSLFSEFFVPGNHRLQNAIRLVN